MRRLVALVVLVACGKPVSEHKAALEQHINVDMRLHWAELRWIQMPFETMGPNGLLNHGQRLVSTMRDKVIPNCERFVAAMKTVQVPAVAAVLHARLVAIVEQYSAIAAEIVAAGNANSGAQFGAAYERYLVVAERRRLLDLDLDELLAEHGTTFDKSMIPKFPPMPAVTRGPCGEDPCPCEPSSEVKTAGRLVSCTFSERQPIRTITCLADKVTFRPDGSVASCVHEGDNFRERGEVQLHPNGELARGVFRVYYTAHARWLCGPGPFTQFDDDSIETCTVVGPAKLNDVTLAKTSKADVVFYRDGAVRYVKHEGVERCFDPTGRPVVPCSR